MRIEMQWITKANDWISITIDAGESAKGRGLPYKLIAKSDISLDRKIGKKSKIEQQRNRILRDWTNKMPQ